MTTRKPALPPKDHIEIAQSIADTIATAGDVIIETLPPKVRESLDYFDEVTRVAADINTVQSEMLRPYATEMAQALVDTGEFDSTSAALAVLTLFKSHEMARLLADVAAGNIEPVAVAPVKAKPSGRPAAKKSAAAPKPAAKKSSPRRKPEPTPAAPAAAVDPEAAPSPVVETPTAPETPSPVDDVPVDPFDAPLPDDPFIEEEPTPAPAPKPTPRPAPVGVGSRFAQDPDDEF